MTRSKPLRSSGRTSLSSLIILPALNWIRSCDPAARGGMAFAVVYNALLVK